MIEIVISHITLSKPNPTAFYSPLIHSVPLPKKVVLADGTIIHESDIQADCVSLGDVLKYEKTLSGDYILKCEKIAESKPVS